MSDPSTTASVLQSAVWNLCFGLQCAPRYWGLSFHRTSFIASGRMSAKIDILTVGYANMIDASGDGPKGADQKKFMRATGSCCLVRSGGMNILFDTMGPWEKDQLVAKLANHNVHPGDIHYLVCSHTHPDHIGNVNQFTSAKKHFLGTSVYTNDEYDLNQFEPIGSYTFPLANDNTVEVIRYQNYELDRNLSIEPTPGHTLECISLIVDNCDSRGRVALAGDLFERQEDVKDAEIWLAAGSQNPDLQRAHRDKIIKRCDYILPGHGPLFKVDR